jgi:hypothetical protein
MTDTTEGIAAASVTTGITKILLNISAPTQKGEPGGSPFRQFAVSLPKRADCTYVSRATRTA